MFNINTKVASVQGTEATSPLAIEGKEATTSLKDYQMLYDDEIIEELMGTPYLESYLSEIEEAIARLRFTSDGWDYLPTILK